MTIPVCSTAYLYHYIINPQGAVAHALIQEGIRPLSDFPDSPQWQALESQIPGFYQQLYTMVAEPIINKPYRNSGIFITPIDFYLLGDLFPRTRFRIPVESIDPDWACITHVVDDERITLPFTRENLEVIADYWTDDRVKKWFGVDNSRLFFYVPQVATYQGCIAVTRADMEQPTPAS